MFFLNKMFYEHFFEFRESLNKCFMKTELQKIIFIFSYNFVRKKFNKNLQLCYERSPVKAILAFLSNLQRKPIHSIISADPLKESKMVIFFLF